MGLFASWPLRAETGKTRRNDFIAPHPLEARRVRGENKAVIGIVEKMSGPGFVSRQGHSARTSISMGLRVFEAERLSTDETSRMHIRYKDGTYLEMGGSTEVEVERMRFKAPNLLPTNKASDAFDEVILRFYHGILRITASEVHALEHFVIKTPAAIVEVSGPADFYLVQLEGDRELSVRVAKGTVKLMNLVTNEAMPVPAGTGAYQKVSGLVNPSGKLTEEQLSFLKSRTRI